MFQYIVSALLVLSIIIPIGVFFMTSRTKTGFKRTLAVNMISFFGMLLFATVIMFSGNVSAAVAEQGASVGDGLKFLAAALSTGIATVGAGIATGAAASSALGALSENEGIMGKALIFVALAEGIAIYGMLISFMILSQ